VAHFLKARTVEIEKQPSLGNGCVTCNNGVQSVPTLYNKDFDLITGESWYGRRIGVWGKNQYDGVSWQGHELWSRGLSIVERH
jgi:hypothetical protein